MPWAAGSIPGHPASPRRGEGRSRVAATTEVLAPTNLANPSEAEKDEEREEEEEEGEGSKEKETTFIEPPQLRARPLSPLVLHSRGEENERGEEGEENSLDYSTEETPVVRMSD